MSMSFSSLRAALHIDSIAALDRLFDHLDDGIEECTDALAEDRSLRAA